MVHMKQIINYTFQYKKHLSDSKAFENSNDMNDTAKQYSFLVIDATLV